MSNPEKTMIAVLCILVVALIGYSLLIYKPAEVVKKPPLPPVVQPVVEPQPAPAPGPAVTGPTCVYNDAEGYKWFTFTKNGIQCYAIKRYDETTLTTFWCEKK